METQTSKLEHTHKQKKKNVNQKNNHYREWHGFARDFFWNHLPFIPVKESYEYERNITNEQKKIPKTKSNKTQQGKRNKLAQ